MNVDLLERLSNNEDNFIERKPETAGSHDFKKTIVGFANSVPEDRSGILFIGVSDDGEPLGVKDTDSLQKKIRKICENECYPKIDYKVEVKQSKGENIVAVIVPESKNRPHFSGPAYIRVGSETKEASEEVYNDLISGRLDICREILKYKNKIVTVTAIKKRLGDTTYLDDCRYRSRHECKIEKCNPHFIKLYDCTSGQYVSEPIKNLALGYDNNKNRLEIIVEPR